MDTFCQIDISSSFIGNIVVLLYSYNISEIYRFFFEDIFLNIHLYEKISPSVVLGVGCTKRSTGSQPIIIMFTIRKNRYNVDMS